MTCNLLIRFITAIYQKFTHPGETNWFIVNRKLIYVRRSEFIQT